MSGSLTVVGTGFLVAGQITPESLACMRGAERLLYLVAEPATKHWLEAECPGAESMHDAFWEGRSRLEAYEEVVERILAPVRAGRQVCAAFYGHPGVFVHPSHEAVRRARAEGFTAFMLPGVSAEDCLFADLGVDPALHGCQSFEASDFVVRRRRVDPRAALVLWQIGALGVTTYSVAPLWNAPGLALLVEALSEIYPAAHEVVVYEAALYPVCEPLVQRVPLADIGRAKVSTYSTLYVPPARQASVDEGMRSRLGLGVAEAEPS
ncbi:MAG TPA: SAM-dependent methyltransferase [Thermoanaerobaculia bacterium]|nr:SAM-dependent methyltransferase [Thermoanaerobaculia bacterium]